MMLEKPPDKNHPQYWADVPSSGNPGVFVDFD
jgi:hypothetical protein